MLFFHHQVETELKSCSFVDNICVYGDSKFPNTIALIQGNMKAIQALAKRLGKASDQLEKFLDDRDILSNVCEALQDHGANAGLRKSSIPTKVKLCKEEWTPSNGLVTATFKIKRKNLINFYKEDIKRFYNNLNI